MILNIIITSTRPGRVGPLIGKWLHNFALQHNCGFEIILTDLADINLPLFNEPHLPYQHEYIHDYTKKWSQIIDKSDAFVFILPEHNSAPPASFVNAVNYLYREWHFKPAGFASYGGVSGGIAAVQVAKSLLNSLKLMPITEQIVLHNVHSQIEGEEFIPNKHHIVSAENMLEAIAHWALIMGDMRKNISAQNPTADEILKLNQIQLK